MKIRNAAVAVDQKASPDHGTDTPQHYFELINNGFDNIWHGAIVPRPTYTSPPVLVALRKEFNSFRRASRPVSLRDFQLRSTETFLYTCGAVDLWEWDVRLLDEDPGRAGDDAPVCLGGRGAAPPQFCGGPTGYRLMLKRQRMGEAMCTPVQMEAVLAKLAASDPEAPPETWSSYREILKEGFESIDRRLEEYGPLEPERFRLEEANQRLAQREERMRWRRA
jgi:hypothetical protein